MKIYKLPTGNITTEKFSKGYLEFLSIGDYGQAANIKADFLGLDSEINGVPNGKIMPLENKWVITVSTQYGCNMTCKFCDVPIVGPGKNATVEDIIGQIVLARKQYPKVVNTERLNLHYARMGEPTFNKAVLTASRLLAKQGREILNLEYKTLHPVLTTMMPKKNSILKSYLDEWIDIKNIDFNGEANIQVSINSTSNEQRDEMYRGCTRSLEEIAELVKDFPKNNGRKYCLNMAMADGNEYDGKYLASLFNPEYWMVKITPIHVNTATTNNNIKTTDGYDLYEFYKPREEAFVEAGFDTLVFVPSYEEDYGMITCGNAILSGRLPNIPYEVTNENY